MTRYVEVVSEKLDSHFFPIWTGSNSYLISEHSRQCSKTIHASNNRTSNALLVRLLLAFMLQYRESNWDISQLLSRYCRAARCAHNHEFPLMRIYMHFDWLYILRSGLQFGNLNVVAQNTALLTVRAHAGSIVIVWLYIASHA